MSVDGELLERIVSGILGEIRASAAASAPQVAPAPKIPDAIVLTEKVITAELLEKSRMSGRKLIVGSKAIFTPSARDYLKQHRIEWTKETAKQVSGTSSAAKWKAIVVTASKNLTNILDDAARSSASWNRELAGCDIDAVDRAVSTLCRAEADGVVLFTTHPETVACRANRNAKVRAVVIENVARLKSARESMGANLLCINPTERSHMELRNLVREAAAVKPSAPKGWKD
jgi:hypothetical protein